MGKKMRKIFMSLSKNSPVQEREFTEKFKNK